ncbi:MAG: RNA-binding transcriptional accessory protein [Deltaproteobacteria bacterium]|nr:RNA-binding transcriptional accessory protein [Deltaproteobacteria bacterium]
MRELVNKIAAELSLNAINVEHAVTLLFDEECSIPFVARYRKEMTGSMDELQLRAVRDRYEYFTELNASRSRYLKVVELHCMTKPELKGRFPEIREQFNKCQSKQELEDLYLPYKPRRRTRAQIAREKGLEALLDAILARRAELMNLQELAGNYLRTESSSEEDGGEEKDLLVKTPEEALQGAADIFAERISEDVAFKGIARDLSYETGYLCSQKWEASPLFSEDSAKGPKKKASKVNPAKYTSYFDYREPVKTAASHRIMAVRRGEAEKVLKIGIEVDKDKILERLGQAVLGQEATTDVVRDWMQSCCQHAYRRLLGPAIETEIRLFLKNRAEDDAIKVFSNNLEKLLLLPPLPGKTVMGIDPGIRTGSKLAVVSETGKLLAHKVISPDLHNPDSARSAEARQELATMIRDHKVDLIAVGNGTGSKEVNDLVVRAVKENKLDVRRVTVNEAGASVYSTDDIAIEEFPDLDPTIRSTISIARRLQDPLAELVKVDPRSIGVGQYQHDCNVSRLSGSLRETVESCVNRVGVNVNTASHTLLAYVSGIGPAVAKNIVHYRDEMGKFSSRGELRKVSGFGPKAFEQAAGFLRIPGGENPLDNSAVHPERYEIVGRIAQDQKMGIHELLGKKELVNSLPLDRYVSEEVGMPTLLDIAQELLRPGRDPREDGSRLTFSDHVSSIKDLKNGMKLKGTVSNVTNFGAFVDIGVHQDGLIHVSELSENFVRDPATVVSVGDVLDVWVLDVDRERSRISLSCRQPQTTSQQRPERGRSSSPQPERRAAAASQPGRFQGGGRQNQQKRPESAGSRSGRQRPVPPSARDKHYSMDDLLKKFGSRS